MAHADIGDLSADDLSALRDAVRHLLAGEGAVIEEDGSTDLNALGYRYEKVFNRLARWHSDKG